MQNELVERITHEVWRQDTDATDLADCRTETMRVFAAIEALGLSVTQGWQDIASAPRDGTRILALYRDRTDNRRVFEIWHEGMTEDGYDLGWALYPGFGGVPEEDFEGWMPLSPLQAARGGA